MGETGKGVLKDGMMLTFESRLVKKIKTDALKFRKISLKLLRFSRYED